MRFKDKAGRKCELSPIAFSDVRLGFPPTHRKESDTMMSDKKQKLETDRLMVQVAKILGDGWKLDKRHSDSSWQTVIELDDGRSLSVDFSKAGRLLISGSGWPASGSMTFCPRHDRTPKISVARDRGVEVIAREIRRRLFPDYFGAFAEQEKVVAVHDEAAAKRGETVASIRKVIGEPSYTRCGQTVFNLDGYGKQITVTSGGQVSIELRYLNSAEALKIIRAMKRYISDK